MGPGSAEFIHTVAECAKLAFADREAWYGDPISPTCRSRRCCPPQYADARRRLVGPQASAELRPGTPDGRAPRLPAFITDPVRAAATARAWTRP